MSAPPEPLRDAVVRRAGQRCEYCQLSAQFQVGGFELDHVVTQSRGGQMDLANMALACPHCNARKWAHIDGEDLCRSSGWHCLIPGRSDGTSIFSHDRNSTSAAA